MTVEIEYVEERTETVKDVVDEVKDNDKIIGKVTQGDRELTQVKRTIVITEEQYIVHTSDGTGKESRSYWIKQNEDEEWYVNKRRINPNRGHSKVKKRGNLSTETVEKAMKEQYGIEIVD